MSKEFSNFLREENITRQLSVEYTPQENGVAERTNRMFVEIARWYREILQSQCGPRH